MYTICVQRETAVFFAVFTGFQVSSFFKLICQSCGLPLSEAAGYLEASPDTTKSWWTGRRNPPESVIEKLVNLAVEQDVAAQRLLLDMGLMNPDNPQQITLKANKSNQEAQALGWPTANAYRAVIRKAVEKMPATLAMRLVLVSGGRQLD